MWSAMISTITSSKLAIGATAAALLVGGSVAIESAGVGSELRHSVGLSVDADAGASAPTLASSRASGAVESRLAVESPSIEITAQVDAPVGSQAELAVATDLDTDSSSGAMALDVTGTLAVLGTSSSAEAHLTGVGASRHQPSATGEVDAAVSVEAQGNAGPRQVKVSPDSRTEAAADVSVSYAALLERARAAVRSLSGQACTEAFVSATARVIGAVDVSLGEQAVLAACAELAPESAIPTAPEGASVGGAVDGDLALN